MIPGGRVCDVSVMNTALYENIGVHQHSTPAEARVTFNDELAKDGAGAEALLEHQEHKGLKVETSLLFEGSGKLNFFYGVLFYIFFVEKCFLDNFVDHF